MASPPPPQCNLKKKETGEEAPGKTREKVDNQKKFKTILRMERFWRRNIQMNINSQSLEDTQVEYILQNTLCINTLKKNTLLRYTLW